MLKIKPVCHLEAGKWDLSAKRWSIILPEKKLPFTLRTARKGSSQDLKCFSELLRMPACTSSLAFERFLGVSILRCFQALAGITSKTVGKLFF